MAEESQDRSPEDLSEEASPYKLEEFRQKGRVAQSREVTAVVALAATGIALIAMAPSFVESLADLMKTVFTSDWAAERTFGESALVRETLVKALKVFAMLGLPVAVVGFIISALGSFAQIGPVFSMDPLMPDLSKINPLEGMKRFFAMKQVWDAIRLIIRATFVLGAAYVILRTEILHAPSTALNDPGSWFQEFGRSGKKLFIVLTLVLAVFAIFDFWLQRWDFGKNVRLTKQEAKQEAKEHEGDPLLKARVRSIQRDMARKRMMDAVKRADVVVTNPTHYAVALKYDRDRMEAPRVVAKGADFLAQQIKKIAADAGVPMVENIELARALHKSVKVGQVIPRALYKAVAEVLAYVYRLKNRMFT